MSLFAPELIETPLLLQQSGITRNIGNSLSMHPAMRAIAQFDEAINDPHEGVPVYQVTEFKPSLTLGGSFSGKPHLGLWLAGRSDCAQRMDKSQDMAIFYALIATEAKGKVRPMPFRDEALVKLPMTKQDWKNLDQGLERLEQLLFAAGAREIIKPTKIDLSTIHLFSSCPMGEDLARSAVNSFGLTHGFDNLFLNDASILPSTPGVNPQAVIMAVARRNTLHFLKQG